MIGSMRDLWKVVYFDKTFRLFSFVLMFMGNMIENLEVILWFKSVSDHWLNLYETLQPSKPIIGTSENVSLSA